MARAVAEALEEKGVLAVEAGTGTGKSLAYLFPALRCARKLGRRGMISTHTLNLQAQLFGRDLPFLLRTLSDSFTVVLLKGRRNYFCPRRIDQALRYGRDLFAPRESEEIARIAQWSFATKTGSWEELEPPPEPGLWSRLCSEPQLCTARTCQDNPRCFYQRLREQSAEADLTIVNHALFFSLLAGGLGSDPSEDLSFAKDFVIFDEAHQVETVAARHLGLSLSEKETKSFLHRLYHPRTGRGLLPLVRARDSIQKTREVLATLSALFDSLRASISGSKGREVRILRPDCVPNILDVPLAELAESIQEAASKATDRDLKREIEDHARKTIGLRASFSAFLSHSLSDHVYWIETPEHGPPDGMRLEAVPLSVASLLERLLYQGERTLVFTSATLTIGGKFHYFQKKLGLQEPRTLLLDSSFDYARQMKICVPRRIPDPSEGAAYEVALAAWIRYFTARNCGSAFVLFTNRRTLLGLASQLAPFFEEKGFPLLVQDGTADRHRLLERFRTSPGAVLFGADSFWQGVDVPGEALSCVILTRLPFGTPDHPLAQARAERLQAAGSDPFLSYFLPEALLKFRQGIGRLIRSREDRGTVAILDSRILTKGYGRSFFGVLPDCPVEILDQDPPIA
ncbi:putative ATP-dependent helicase DinG [Methylacidimicrobium cyclopophantes]|uniref:ATP-dependent helicase DinG n=1 Tax=Methylacidimicrobium cyclopophantes TaxID=1041766 RepID=A0A5E6MPT5_9BACT|nr:helicase C-terminal domain-containing protein [Methylacidimicrobium cyclopophantes]VVM07490.1 putative ATP-dependent helicase DinG [Methylacidimicrobium cyclopophantes]